jgi:two-component system nitrate/nitrite response regulator NarL
VLGHNDQIFDQVAAFQAGSNAYFRKDIARHALIKGLELVMLGETILPPSLLSCIPNAEQNEQRSSAAVDPKVPAQNPVQIEGNDLPRLSSREIAILRCIVEGASNKVIARRFDITEGTVKVHVKAILRKIRAGNRTQAAIWAMNHASLIWPEDSPLTSAVGGVFIGGTQGQFRSGSVPAPINHNARATGAPLSDRHRPLAKYIN